MDDQRIVKRVIGTPFKKGNPGGPGNPLAKVTQELRSRVIDLLRHGEVEKCIATLLEIRDDSLARPEHRLAACKELLDRGIGKAVQPIESDGDGVQIAIVMDAP